MRQNKRDVSTSSEITIVRKCQPFSRALTLVSNIESLDGVAIEYLYMQSKMPSTSAEKVGSIV